MIPALFCRVIELDTRTAGRTLQELASPVLVRVHRPDIVMIEQLKEARRGGAGSARYTVTRVPKKNASAGIISAVSRNSQPAPLLHWRWVTYLLLMGHTNDLIRQVCLNDDLPEPDEAVLNALRATLNPPKRLKRGSAKHRPSAEYLRNAELEPISVKSQEATEALTVLRTPRARELVEAAVLVGVPGTSISKVLAAVVKLEATSAGVLYYQKLFFDIAAVSRAQLRVLVQARVRHGLERIFGSKEDEPAIRRAVAGDARMLAVALAYSPLSWNAVLLSMGYAPSRCELGSIVGQMETLAATRAAQALLRGGPNDDRRAAGFTSVLRDLRQVHEGVQDPGKELAQGLVTLVHEEAPVVTVSEALARGEGVTMDTIQLEPNNELETQVGKA